MITFTRVDHISMASADWRPQAERLQRLLGFKYLSNWEGNDHQDFSGSLSQVPGTGIEFEIIAPYGSPSFVQKFLDQGGPGLHHITIEVPDIQRCAEEIKALGLTPFGGIQDDGAWYVVSASDLADLCDVEGVDLGEFCERVIAEAVRAKVHAATVLADRVARRGKVGNPRERDPAPGEAGRELPFSGRR